jgi:hypothetical protein
MFLAILDAVLFLLYIARATEALTLHHSGGSPPQLVKSGPAGRWTFKPSQCPKDPQSPPVFIYEFGWEVNIAVPHAYFLYMCGKLASTTSCGNLSAYYWFSPEHHVLDHCDVKGFVYGMQYEGVRCSEYLQNFPLDQWLPPPH